MEGLPYERELVLVLSAGYRDEVPITKDNVKDILENWKKAHNFVIPKVGFCSPYRGFRRSMADVTAFTTSSSWKCFAQ